MHVSWGWYPMFTSQDLSVFRGEDGSYKFNIKLEASIFADEASFSRNINFTQTLKDLCLTITKTLSGSEEIKKLFQEQILNLEDNLSTQTSSIQTIFEFAGILSCRSAGFDLDGDGDILKINFAGKNVEIQRSCLTKPVIGWNLFSCLFEKRWDRLHVRDRTGRIYVDLKEEWMRPLIDYMNHNVSANSSIKSMTVFLRTTMKQLCLSEKYLLRELVPGVSWVGLESSQLFHELPDSTVYACRRCSGDFFPCIATYFKQVYSTSKPSDTLDSDIRFKPVFCLWKTVMGKVFVLFLSWSQRPSAKPVCSLGLQRSRAQFSINKRQKQVNAISDLFPVQFKCDEIDYSINNPPNENEVLELYEVYSSMYLEATPKSPFVATVSTTAESRDNPFPLMEKVQEWCSLVNQVGQEICTLGADRRKS
jgi:hypothetical protein